MPRAVSRMLKQSRLREIQEDLRELEYDYRNKVELDGELKVTETEYFHYRADLLLEMEVIEKELGMK